MVPGGPRVLPGGCLVVTGHKMNVLESLGKGVFGPLAPGGVWGGSSPILGRTRPPGARRGVWGDPPPILGTKLAPLVSRGGVILTSDI